MAFTSLRHSDDFGTTISGADYTFVMSVDIEVGDLIILHWDANAASKTVVSIADDSVQAGAANSYTVRATRSATAHSAGTAYCLKTTRKIVVNDEIVVTIDAAHTRRAGCMAAFVPGNGNAALGVTNGVTGDTSSPVTYGATGTLSDAHSLLAQCGGWRGGAVDAGYGHNPSGWATVTPGKSGGTSARAESHIAYILDSGTNGTITCEDTYTSITNAHGEVLEFTDIAVAAARPRIVIPRRVWAGR